MFKKTALLATLKVLQAYAAKQAVDQMFEAQRRAFDKMSDFQRRLARRAFIYRRRAMYARNWHNPRTVGCELELVMCRLSEDGSFYEIHGKVAELVEKIAAQHPKLAKFFDIEFSAHQIEIRTGVHICINQMLDELFELIGIARKVAAELGYELHAVEYIDCEYKFAALDVTPGEVEPAYLAFAMQNPSKIDAMCRVAAFQVSFGLCSEREAIDVHNRLIEALPELMLRWMDSVRKKLFGQVIAPGVFDTGPLQNLGELFDRMAEAGCLGGRKGRYYPAIRLQDKIPVAEVRIGGATDDREQMFRMICEFFKVAFPREAPPLRHIFW